MRPWQQREVVRLNKEHPALPGGSPEPGFPCATAPGQHQRRQAPLHGWRRGSIAGHLGRWGLGFADGLVPRTRAEGFVLTRGRGALATAGSPAADGRLEPRLAGLVRAWDNHLVAVA